MAEPKKELTEEEKIQKEINRFLNEYSEDSFEGIYFLALIKKNFGPRTFLEFMSHPEHKKALDMWKIFREAKRTATKNFTEAFRDMYPRRKIKTLGF
jgi:hypothetical protein